MRLKMPEQLSLWNFADSRRPAPSPTDCVLFMAYPDAEDAARLAQLAEELRREHRLNGPALATDRLHVSLHFLGYVSGAPPANLISALREAVSEVSMAPFDVWFDRAVSFRRSGKRPFVLLGGEGAEALQALQRALRGAMKRVGLARGALNTPHMTLLYDHRSIGERPVRPVRWRVRDFTLVRSRRGRGQHIPLARLPLRA
jgi:2'-5' RNA ligase